MYLRLRGIFVAFVGGFAFFEAGAGVRVDGTALAEGLAREEKPHRHEPEGEKQNDQCGEEFHSCSIGQAYLKIKPSLFQVTFFG